MIFSRKVGSIFGRYTLWFALKQGRDDARENYPHEWDEEPVGYGKELESEANRELAQIEQAYIDHDTALRQDVKRVENKERHESRELAEVEQKYEADDLRAIISDRLHHTVLSLLAVGEFPLNLIAFQAWRQSYLDTLIMTIGVAGCVILGAFLFGKNYREPKRTSGQTRMMIGGLSLALVTTVMVACWRAAVLPPPEPGTSMPSPLTASITFSVLQTFVFAIAAWVSFLNHDPVRYHRRWHAKAQNDLDHARVGRKQAYDKFRSEADELRHLAFLLFDAYAGENLKDRTDGLRRLPRIDPIMPPKLRCFEPSLLSDEGPDTGHGGFFRRGVGS